MDQPDIEKYIAVMNEIKLRTDVITLFLSGKREAKYLATNIETIGLQFRKVFELIAFASLVANRSEYSTAWNDFARHWEAAKLLKNLLKINPRFYPKPVVETPSNQPGIVHALEDRPEDYLTQKDLIYAHGRCGSLMHSANPFGQPIDYAFYQQQFPSWIQKVINLLNNHQVHLVGDAGFYLIHMQEDGHDKVSHYRFARVSTNS